jgi:hypothetical protein
MFVLGGVPVNLFSYCWRTSSIVNIPLGMFCLDSMLSASIVSRWKASCCVYKYEVVSSRNQYCGVKVDGRALQAGYDLWRETG